MKTNKKEKIKGIPVPVGTEQETGFTRGETEKNVGPVKIEKDKSKKIKRDQEREK